MSNLNSPAPLSRREFLRLLTTVGGTAALASFLEGCARAGVDPATLLPPAATPAALGADADPLPASTATTASTPEPPQPTATQPEPSATPTTAVQEDVARIAFVKTTDRAAGVRQALDLLGVNPVAGKRVFLKPNFNSADPTPGSTHLDVLSALITALQALGAQHITLGDRSGMGDTRRVMEQLGVFRLASELGFDALVLDELPPEAWVRIQPPNGHWSSGFFFARPCAEADAVVQTCCLKTHRYGGHFTLSLKNSVGLVAKRHPEVDHDLMQELHASPHQRRMIAEINAAYTPDLVVLDGVEAFISGGPDVGERVAPEVILAGTDRIALDAVGVALLRHFGCRTEAGQGPIFEQEQIARAVELGLGVDRPDKIEFLTADSASAAYSEQIKALLLAG